MSTVKAVNFQHPSSSAVNLSLDSAGGVSGGLPSPNRNLLYNGAMQVAQRGTSTASANSAGGYYTADRWNLETAGPLGVFTQSVENDAPTGSGLRRSLRMLCTTAEASPAAGRLLLISQRIEGQDLQRVAKGTSSAQQLTLSFWVKANVTGTYVVLLHDIDNTRAVGATYSVSASATWEKKTITFPADTTGAFDNDNARSLDLKFFLGAGSTYTSGTLPTTWASYSDANAAVGQVNLAAATNNYWQVTGVQLEVGPVATPFEFKSYGQELRECQRYYVRWNGNATSTAYIAQGIANSGTQCNGVLHFPVEMRANPTAVDSSGACVTDDVSLNFTGGTLTMPGTGINSTKTAYIRYTHGSSALTTYRPMFFFLSQSATSYIGLSAEL